MKTAGRSISLLAIAIGVLLLIGPPAGGERARSGGEHCSPAGTTTLIDTARVRVYQQPRRRLTIACLKASGKKYELDSPRTSGRYAYEPPGMDVSRYTLAFAVQVTENEGGRSSFIRIVDLRDPADSSRRPIGLTYLPGFNGDAKIGSVAVRANGAVAWVACERRRRDGGETPDPEPECGNERFSKRIYRVSSGQTRRRLIGRGRRIDGTSLRYARAS